MHHKVDVWLAFLFLLVVAGYALHDEGSFPFTPDITCQYAGTNGTMRFSYINTLEVPLHLQRAPVMNATTLTHVSTILNGRLVDPGPYCDRSELAPGEVVTCNIPFNPLKNKTGDFRFFHQRPTTSRGHFLKRPNNVIRMRLLSNGSKTRKNFPFSCQKMLFPVWDNGSIIY